MNSFHRITLLHICYHIYGNYLCTLLQLLLNIDDSCIWIRINFNFEKSMAMNTRVNCLLHFCFSLGIPVCWSFHKLKLGRFRNVAPYIKVIGTIHLLNYCGNKIKYFYLKNKMNALLMLKAKF